jgi:hypothetical protein
MHTSTTRSMTLASGVLDSSQMRGRKLPTAVSRRPRRPLCPLYRGEGRSDRQLHRMPPQPSQQLRTRCPGTKGNASVGSKRGPIRCTLLLSGRFSRLRLPDLLALRARRRQA